LSATSPPSSRRAASPATSTASAGWTPSSTTPASTEAARSCRSNIVAPYLLTALIEGPQRLIYLSSGAHRSGRANLDGVDWSGRGPGSYSDSKLYVTTLAVAVPRLRPDVFSNAVDPGWVPTKMGGPGAPDDLRLGHLTQEWLATSDDPDARTSGGYWHHQHRTEPHPAVRDPQFQDQLLDELGRFTATRLV